MAQDYPDDLKYLDTHEYVRLEGDTATIGISAFALDQLGDIVFLELPEIDDALDLDANFGTIESVKAVEDLYPPVAGTVLERNENAIENPESIAEDPYGEGWLIKIRVDDPQEVGNLINSSDYQALVEGED